ncbi:MAG: type IV pilus assembly protein PilM [Patescibacteria group bacterium]|nr:type IV pilus assembly protein PilM [Patescibacteria group bacterium]
MGLFFPNESYLGIDIGSSSIKIVELKNQGGRAMLLTYGFSENLDDLDQADPKKIAEIINKICSEAGMVSRKAVSALPSFSVFSSIINLAGVSKKDLPSAINWEAKKVIPLPPEEMILDWKKIENFDQTAEKADKNNIKVLLTGAPRTLVKRYIEIFKNAQINLLSLETETFALIRSLLGNDKSAVMVVEIGAKTTSFTIIDQSIPTLNRSIDIGGWTITKAISHSLNIGLERAEQFKYDLGVGSFDSADNAIPKTIIESISPIVNEIKYALNLFQNKNNKKVDKIILSGGSALLMNFTDYLSKILNINVVAGNPWSTVSYPVDLKPLLDEIAPRMAIAIGLALREME